MQTQCLNCGQIITAQSNFCPWCGVPPTGGLTGPVVTGRLSPGAMLGTRYLVVSLLGRGGMGAVYKATDTRIPGRVCAIKEMSVLNLLPVDRPTAVRNFEREATLLAKLDHPNLPQVSDFFQDGASGRHCLVMEFIDGQTLEELLVQQGTPFSEDQVREWAGQLCDVLQYLHSQSPPIIFRDLKPNNIMLDERGQIKLIDFGIVRFFRPGQGADTQSFGTPGFSPPEQYGKGQTDGRSDIYSLGVTLLRLLTGHDPGADPFNLPSACQIVPAVSADLDRIIQRAVRHDPDSRCQNAQEFRAALDGTPELTVKWHLATPIPWRWALGGALVVAVTVLLVVRGALPKPEPTLTPEVVALLLTHREMTVTPSRRPTTVAPSASRASGSASGSEGAAPTLEPTIVVETPSFTPTPTPMPTSTPRPAYTPTSYLTPSSTSCAYAVYSAFQAAWRANTSQLGCPTSAGKSGVWMAQEDFQGGKMFWRQDNGKIYVLYRSGRWERYDNIWREGDPEFSCSAPESPPTPKRGFGKIWCKYDAVRQGLGEATNGEWGEGGSVQDFGGGWILQSESGAMYIFYSNGTWRR